MQILKSPGRIFGALLVFIGLVVLIIGIPAASNAAGKSASCTWNDATGSFDCSDSNGGDEGKKDKPKGEGNGHNKGGCYATSPSSGKDVKVDCSSKHGTWYVYSGDGQNLQCYFKASPDNDPEEVKEMKMIVYNTMCPQWSGNTISGWTRGPEVALDENAIPPTITPEEAAARLWASYDIRKIDIGIAPKPDAGSVGSVGLPVWMWVNNPSEKTFGPYKKSAAYEGLSITGTAKVTNIVWNMGDGSTVQCNGAGTPFTPSAGLNPSPDCGHMYEKMSKSHAGGRFPVSATANWVFEWSTSGASGTLTATRTSGTSLEIGEMQTVIR